MKKFLWLIFFLSLAVLAVQCSKDGAEGKKSKPGAGIIPPELVGTWEGENLIIEFREDDTSGWKYLDAQSGTSQGIMEFVHQAGGRPGQLVIKDNNGQIFRHRYTLNGDTMNLRLVFDDPHEPSGITIYERTLTRKQ